MLLEHIEHTTAANPDACIIWLHGLGADGNDFAGIVPDLNLPPELRLRFIFPHAPYRSITLNNGHVMRGWYDLVNLNIGSAEDDVGLCESADQINDFIDHQLKLGIKKHRIFLAGFSQGGAVALYTGLRQADALGGIVALSSYIPLVGNPASEIITDRSLPLFLAHGRHDDVVKYHYGIQGRAWLQQQGYRVDWHEYAMAHSVCMEEITDIRQWLVARLQTQN